MPASKRLQRYIARRKRVPRLLKGPKFSKAVKTIVNRQSEKKFIYDNVVSQATYSGADTIACNSMCAQGDDVNNRTGKQIRVTKWEMRVRVDLPSGEGNSQPIRVLLFRAHGDEFGALPTAAGVMDNFQSVATTTSNVLEPWAPPGRKVEYTKLLDKTIVLGPNPIARTRIFSFKKVFKVPVLLQYSGTAAAIGSISSGHLFILARSTSDATDPPTISYMSRVSFLDD